MQLLEGRRALVCGSSRGIGRACAMEFARLGAEVRLLARNEESLANVLAEPTAGAGCTHRFLRADYADPAALPDVVAGDIAAHGPMHILANNKGGSTGLL